MTNEEFQKYIGKTFTDRLNELGLNKNKFATKNNLYKEHNTILRVFNGTGGCTMSTILKYAELLDLEIIIRPKEK